MDRTIRLGGFYRSLPMMAAEQHGFYAEANVEVEFDQVKSSTQQCEFLSDGRYNVVQTSPDNTANYRINTNNPISRRVDAQGVLGLDYGMKLILVARPEFTSVENLRGETVSVDAPASGFAYVLYRILEVHGLERQKDYDVVSHGGVYDRYVALVDHDEPIAATLMSGGFETRAANVGFNLLDSVFDIADPYLGAWAAARRDWLGENRELVVDFIRAYLQATSWVFDSDNRNACLNLLQQMPNISEELASQLYEVQVEPGVGNVPDGSIDPEGVRNVLQLRDDFSGFEEAQDLDELVSSGTDLFDLSYLEDARKA